MTPKEEKKHKKLINHTKISIIKTDMIIVKILSGSEVEAVFYVKIVYFAKKTLIFQYFFVNSDKN